MGFIAPREKVYVGVVSEAMPNGNFRPLFIKWPDGRIFPVTASEGGPFVSPVDPDAPASAMGLPYEFRVFVGCDTAVRRLYCEVRDVAIPPRWYVMASTEDDGVPFDPPPRKVPYR